MPNEHLEIDIYQIADDCSFSHNRADGTGWQWSWAQRQRTWMDNTQSRFAYRCLPLTIANQLGIWVKNPVGFTALWNGGDQPSSIEFKFDAGGDFWRDWVTDQFGWGIITWNTPFLFRTRPAGSRLLVSGPINYFKANAQPLIALIESDWMIASFTMNWKIAAPGIPVRFEFAEPLFQVIPLLSDVCSDLERAEVKYAKLGENAEFSRLYQEWQDKRREFHERKAQGVVPPDAWQKEYFLGKDAFGRSAAPMHSIKVRPPSLERSTVGLVGEQEPKRP